MILTCSKGNCRLLTRHASKSLSLENSNICSPFFFPSSLETMLVITSTNFEMKSNSVTFRFSRDALSLFNLVLSVDKQKSKDMRFVTTSMFRGAVLM
jgi:hypothetical protein